MSCDAIHLAQEADHTRFTGDTIPAVAAAIAGLHGMDDVVGVPVGWRGKGGGHCLLLLVQKATADDVPTYRITVCSGGGPGVQYHPVRNATPKLQRKLAITITNVPASRWVGFESKCVHGTACASILVADRGCWLLHRLLNPAFLYALLRLRSTCHAGNNAKVLYEAVLPYVVVYHPLNVRACATLTLGTRTALRSLTGKSLPESWVNADPCADWMSTQRCERSSARCCFTAFKYLLRRGGATHVQVKQVRMRWPGGCGVLHVAHLLACVRACACVYVCGSSCGAFGFGCCHAPSPMHVRSCPDASPTTMRSCCAQHRDKSPSAR